MFPFVLRVSNEKSFGSIKQCFLFIMMILKVKIKVDWTTIKRANLDIRVVIHKTSYENS